MMTLEQINIELEGLGITTAEEYFDHGFQYGICAYKGDKPIHAVRFANSVTEEEIREGKYYLLKYLKDNYSRWKTD